jgi:hypothetical protein
MAGNMANTRTIGFADTMAMVEDGLSNNLVLEGKYEAEHSDGENIPNFSIEFGRYSGVKELFVFVCV